MIDPAGIGWFDWDGGNARKSEKHDVSIAKAERVFLNAPLVVLTNANHSDRKSRFPFDYSRSGRASAAGRNHPP
jgi:uncharacterized DUF497 family protein